jgi:ribosomal subunit interface protein
MKVSITARHGEIPEQLRIRADALVTRLAKLANRPTSAHVTFDVDHQRATAEVVLHAARGAVHVASADAGDHRSALDRVAAKIRRQLDKQEARPVRSAARKAVRR